MIKEILLVGTGGFIGAVFRMLLSDYFTKNYKFTIPLHTLTVNLIGSFLLGYFLGGEMQEMTYLFTGAGVMGALTTFSTLHLELWKLHLARRWKTVVIYTLISYGGGLGLAILGYFLS
ncbi:fluoride efflux transporter FluC [Thalassobacillus pellis]|uniref:fluoride efflux transporter FluC n=1 Tax=Thalassobacillus pellis TaxID=748008 RepID=UPI001960A949|nr:CrcB family protein [Thalassobacillus pellis]MBM7551163.1 CrcB protein [Thalassobacillus pellis]